MWQLSSCEVDIERFRVTTVREAVKGSILPPVEGHNSVLLEDVPIEYASSVGGVRTENRNSGFGEHGINEAN